MFMKKKTAADLPWIEVCLCYVESVGHLLDRVHPHYIHRHRRKRTTRTKPAAEAAAAEDDGKLQVEVVEKFSRSAND
jgi:hypothetical protein